MKIYKWLALLPLHLAVILLRYPLAPIAVLLFSSSDKRRLTRLKWLETIDNDLTGDDGWKTEHITGVPLAFWNCVKWLWRNGGNRFNYETIGTRAFITYQVGPSVWRNADGYWMLRKKIPLFGKTLELFWGWSLHGRINGLCKYTFTTRLTK